jgi:hypothetical protein
LLAGEYLPILYLLAFPVSHSMRLIPILALAALACTDSTAPNHGLEIKAEVAPATIHIGDVATISITMTNRSDKSQTVETNVCGDAFVVKDRQGDVVAPPSEICDMYSSPRTLTAGEQFAYTASRTAQSPGGAGLAPIQTPGTYLVSGPQHYDGASSITAAIQILP